MGASTIFFVCIQKFYLPYPQFFQACFSSNARKKTACQNINSCLTHPRKQCYSPCPSATPRQNHFSLCCPRSYFLSCYWAHPVVEPPWQHIQHQKAPPAMQPDSFWLQFNLIASCPTPCEMDSRTFPLWQQPGHVRRSPLHNIINFQSTTRNSLPWSHLIPLCEPVMLSHHL